MKIGAGLVCGSFAAALMGGLAGSFVAHADPAAEQRYLSDLAQYVHPGITAPRLLELGNLTCAVRRGGGSTDDASAAVSKKLDAAGVLASNAEMGSLVHVAIDNLCPEVGYP